LEIGLKRVYRAVILLGGEGEMSIATAVAKKQKETDICSDNDSSREWVVYQEYLRKYLRIYDQGFREFPNPPM
jgi:hypothetical protein